MAAFVRLNADRPVLEPGQRVIAAEDYALRLSAEQLLEEAQVRSQEMAEESKRAYSESQERGYQDGIAKAKAEMAEQMLTMVSTSVDYLATAENKVADAVMICLRKILDEMPEEDLVRAAARSALSVVRNEPRVTLAVRPEVRQAINDRIDSLLQGHSDIGFVEVTSDSGLGIGGCKLETEVGVVDASIEVQIEAIEKALRARTQDRRA